MAPEFSTKEVNEWLTNYLQGKNDGTGTKPIKTPIQTVLNSATAAITESGDTITTDDDNSALLKLKIKGTLTSEGINNSRKSDKVYNEGFYRVYFNNSTPSYITSIQDQGKANQTDFQAIANGWTFQFEKIQYPNAGDGGFKELFKFEDTGTGFTYNDYTNSKREIFFDLNAKNEVQATTKYKNTDDNGNSKTVKVKYKRGKDNASDQNIVYAIDKRSLEFKRGDDGAASLVTEEQPPFKFNSFSKSFEFKEGKQQPEPIFSGSVSLELGSNEATKKTIEGSVTKYQQKTDEYFNKNYVSKLGLKVEAGTEDNPLFPKIGDTTISIQSGTLSMDYTADVQANKEKIEANKEKYSRTGTFTGEFDADVKLNTDTSLNGKVRYVAAKTDLSKTFYTQQVLGQLTASGISFDPKSSTFKPDAELYYGYYKYPEKLSEEEQKIQPDQTVAWREVSGMTGTFQLKNAPGLLNSIKVSAGKPISAKDSKAQLDEYAAELKKIKPELLRGYVTENRWGFANAQIELANKTKERQGETIQLGPISTSKISGEISKNYKDDKQQTKTIPFGFFKYTTGVPPQSGSEGSTTASDDFGIKAEFENVNIDLGFLAKPLQSISTAATSVTDNIQPAINFLTQEVNIANSLPDYLRTPVVEFIEATPGNQYRDNRIQVVELIDVANAAITWSQNKQPKSITKPLFVIDQSLKFLNSLATVDESQKLSLGDIKWTIPLYQSTEDANQKASEELGKVLSKEDVQKIQDEKIAKDLDRYEQNKKANNIADAWSSSNKETKYKGDFNITFPLYHEPEKFVKDLIFEDRIDLLSLVLDLEYKQTYDFDQRIAAFPALKIGLEGGVGIGLKTRIDSSLKATDLYGYAKNSATQSDVIEKILDGISIDLDQTKASLTANLGLKLALDAVLAEASVSAGLEGKIALQPVLVQEKKEKDDQSISVEMIRKSLAEKKDYQAQSPLENITYQYSIDFSDAASEHAESNRYFSINVPFGKLNFNAEGELIEKDGSQADDIAVSISSTGWLKKEESVNKLHLSQGNKKQKTVEFVFSNDDHIREQLKERITELYKAQQGDSSKTIDETTINKITETVINKALPESVIEYAILGDNQNEPSTKIEYVSIRESSIASIDDKYKEINKPQPMTIFPEDSSYKNAPFYIFAPSDAGTGNTNPEINTNGKPNDLFAIKYNAGELSAEDLKKPFTIEFSIGSTLNFEDLKQQLNIKFGDSTWNTLGGLTGIQEASATLIQKEAEDSDSKYRTILLIFGPKTPNEFTTSPNLFLKSRLSNDNTLDIFFKLADDVDTETQKETGIRQIVTTKNLSLGYTSEDGDQNRMVTIPEKKSVISEQYNAVNKIDSTFYAQSAWLRPNAVNNKQTEPKSITTDEFLRGAALIQAIDSNNNPIETKEDLVSIVKSFSSKKELTLNLDGIDFSKQKISRLTTDPVTKTSYQLTVYGNDRNAVSIISKVADASGDPLDIIRIYDGLPIHDITSINGHLLATRRSNASDSDDIQIINIETNESLQGENRDNDASFHYSIQQDLSIPRQFTETAMLNGARRDTDSDHNLRIGLYKLQGDQFTIAVSDMNNGNVYAAATNEKIFSNEVVQTLNQEYRDLSANAIASSQDHAAVETSDGIFNRDSFLLDQENNSSFSKELEQSLHTLNNITPGILLGGIVRSNSRYGERWLNGFADTFEISKDVVSVPGLKDGALPLSQNPGEYEWPFYSNNGRVLLKTENGKAGLYVAPPEHNEPLNAEPKPNWQQIIDFGGKFYYGKISNGSSFNITFDGRSFGKYVVKLPEHATSAALQDDGNIVLSGQSQVSGLQTGAYPFLPQPTNLSSLRPVAQETAANLADYTGYLKSFDFPEFNDIEALHTAPQRSFFVTYANANNTGASKTLVINTGIDDTRLEALTRVYFSQPAKVDRQIYPQAQADIDGGIWPSKSDNSWTNIFNGALQTSVSGVYDTTSVLFMPKSNPLTVREQAAIETFTSIRGLDKQFSQEEEAPSSNIISFISSGKGGHLKLAYNIEENKPQIKAFDISSPRESFPSLKITDESSSSLEQFYPLTSPYLNTQNNKSLDIIPANSAISFAGFDSSGLERLKFHGINPSQFLLRAPTNDTIQLAGTDAEESVYNTSLAKYSLLNHYYSHHDYNNQQHPWVARQNQWSLPLYLKARNSDQIKDPNQNQSYFGFVNKNFVAPSDSSGILKYAESHLKSLRSGYQLVLTNRGGLSLFNLGTNEEVWFAQNNGIRVIGAKQAFMQPDGNFVLYEKPVEDLNKNGSAENSLLWSSGTSGNNQSSLGLTEDGTLAIIDSETKIGTILYSNADEEILTILENSNQLTRKDPIREIGTYKLELTDKGGLSLFDLTTNKEIWYAKQNNRRVEGAEQALMQHDGNFVLYRIPTSGPDVPGSYANEPVYSSVTDGFGPATSLKISTRGTLSIVGESADNIKVVGEWKPSENFNESSQGLVFLESTQLTPSNQLLTNTSDEEIKTLPLFNFESPADPFQLTTLGANGKYESAMILSGATKQSSADAVGFISKYANSEPSSFSFLNPLETETEAEFNSKSVFSSIPTGKTDQSKSTDLKTFTPNSSGPNSQYNYSDIETSFMLARGDDQVPRLLNVSTSDQLLTNFEDVKDAKTSNKAKVLYDFLPSVKSEFESSEQFAKHLAEDYKQVSLRSKTQLLNGNPHPYIEIRDNLAYSNRLADQSITSSITSDNPTELDLKLSAKVDAYLRADARLLWKSINLASLRIPIWEMDPKYIATGIVFAGETKLKKNSLIVKQYLNQKLVNRRKLIGLLNKRIFAVKDLAQKNTADTWIVSKPNIIDTSVMNPIGLHLSAILEKQSANGLTPKSALLTMPHHSGSDKESLNSRFDLIKRTLPLDLKPYLSPTLKQQANVVNSIQLSNRLTQRHKNHLIDNYTLLSTLKAVNWLTTDQQSLRKQTLKASQNTYSMFIDYLKKLDNQGQRADLNSEEFYQGILTFTMVNSKQSAPDKTSQLAKNLFQINQILRETIINHQGNYSSLIDSISPLKNLAFETEHLLETNFAESHTLLPSPDFPKQRKVRFAQASSFSDTEKSLYEIAINKPNAMTSNGISKPISVRSDNLKYGQSHDFFFEGFPHTPPSTVQIDPEKSALGLSIQAGDNLKTHSAKGSITIQMFDRFQQLSKTNKNPQSFYHVFWNGSEFKSLKNWSPISTLLQQTGVRLRNVDHHLMARRNAIAAFNTPMAVFAYEQAPNSPQSTKTLAKDSLSRELSESSQYLLLENDHFYTRSKRPQNEVLPDKFAERVLVYEFNSETDELKTYLRPNAPADQRSDSDESISVTTSEPIYFKKIPDQFRIIDPLSGVPTYNKKAATIEAPETDSPSATDALTFRVKPAASTLILDLESLVDYSYVDIQLQSPKPTSTKLVFQNKNDFDLDYSDPASVTIAPIDSPASGSMNLRLWDQNGESLSLYNFNTETLL